MAMCSCDKQEATMTCYYCPTNPKMCTVCYQAHQAACPNKVIDEAIFGAERVDGGGKALIVVQNRERGWRA